jgi:hypothetical protein
MARKCTTNAPLFGLNTPCFRAIVLHGNKNMNVTLKLPDDVVREARIRAVHDSKSLSAWMADLVRRELGAEQDISKPKAPQSLFEAMQVPGMPDWFYEKEFPLPDRNAEREREFQFEPEDE